MTETTSPTGAGKRLLLHICCGPCATYSVRRLRDEAWELTGLWFNPNIHPFSEHERRRETLASFAAQVALPVQWESGYEMPAFLRAVVGHEAFRERCQVCYRLRLERAARAAAAGGYDAYCTTLLISPYQDQAAIRRIGEELGAQHGVPFYFENLRRGYAETPRPCEQYGLYRQRYCGCLYSEWEALEHAKER
jgi:epoxyqueuosine reductase